MSELKTADAWTTLVTECPDCGEVFNIDEKELIDGTWCQVCNCEFMPKE